jgi:hypothetical protein
VENYRKEIIRELGLIGLGIFLGVVPGQIRLDQMRHEAQATAASTATEIGALRQTISVQRESADECRQVLLGDGSVTVLIDRNHPFGGAMHDFFGAMLALPPMTTDYTPYGPVWVIHRRVTPQVEDGALGGVYTHISPNGLIDGWHVPGRAQQIQ